MIMQLKGKISYKGVGFLVLDSAGVGYKVHILKNVLSHVQENKETLLWTHLAVRENAMELYGFSTKEELDFFEMLIDVSGIGPKGALAILTLTPVKQLIKAIAAGDTTYLTKVSGIGRKSAGKIIVELKDKLEKMSGGDDVRHLKEASEVLEALKALGYSTQQARGALQKVGGKPQGTSEKIKEALKLLSRQ